MTNGCSTASRPSSASVHVLLRQGPGQVVAQPCGGLDRRGVQADPEDGHAGTADLVERGLLAVGEPDPAVLHRVTGQQPAVPGAAATVSGDSRACVALDCRGLIR